MPEDGHDPVPCEPHIERMHEEIHHGIEHVLRLSKEQEEGMTFEVTHDPLGPHEFVTGRTGVCARCLRRPEDDVHS